MTDFARLLTVLSRGFVNLETLIRLKRAAGRPKDLERLAELELLWQEQRSATEDPHDRTG